MEVDLRKTHRACLSARVVEHGSGDIDGVNHGAVPSRCQGKGGRAATEVDDDGARGNAETLEEGLLRFRIGALLGIVGGDLVNALEIDADLMELVVVPPRKLHGQWFRGRTL